MGVAHRERARGGVNPGGWSWVGSGGVRRGGGTGGGGGGRGVGWVPVVLLGVTIAAGKLEKAMATHSSTLAWKIPWTEEPGRLQSMRSLRVGHD